MATVTISTAGELLKRLYAQWDIEQLVNLTHPALSECAKKGSADLGGSGFYFPVRVESAHGHAYIAETASLPTGRVSTVLQATVSPTVHAGVVQLSGLSMAVSQGSAMAFARAFDENVQQTIQAMSAYKEGAFFRDGTGLLGVPRSSTSTSTIPMTDVQYFREGMVVDIAAATTGSPAHKAAGVEIIGVNWPSKSLTFSTTPGGTSITTSMGFYIDGFHTASSALASNEPIGLAGSIKATGSYLGIARGTYANWQAQTLAASSFLDEDILLRARTRVTQEAGIGLGDMARRFKVLCHPMQVDVLFKLAVPRIRYAGGGDFDLGHTGNVKFGGIDFVTSYQCPPATAYLGDFSYSQTLYTPGGELHVDSELGGSSLKWVATKDVGLCFVKEYAAFVVKRPNAFISITSLTEQTR